MVEVFITNVMDQGQADRVITQIYRKFANYKANFDLSDCDHILRVKCATSPVDTCSLIELLQQLGFTAEILLDDRVPIPVFPGIKKTLNRSGNP